MQFNTLKSVARLFAIVANKDLDSPKEKYINVFSIFINNIVDQKYVEIFRNEFETFLLNSSTGSNLKKLSLNSVKLISILEELSSKLLVTDRILVLTYLVLLIEETGRTEVSLTFANEVALSFSIETSLIDSIIGFVNKGFNKSNSDINRENLFSPGGDVILLRVDKAGFSHNGINLKANSICVLTKESVICDQFGKNYFYSEIEAIFKSENTDKIFLLSVRDLEYKKKNHVLIKKMSLDFENSQMIAVMGNSGSGKTSFLKCISQQTNDCLGAIHYYSNDNSELSIAFVPQENSFVPGFTVVEHLRDRCRFLQFNTESIEKKCYDILDFVGLKSVINNKVCKTDFSVDEISGGQQKRLSIATELLHDPDVIILDEPTSGLSSEDSYEIISRLKKLSMEGKLVFASIHQPDFDLFMMFDKVLIFADGGYPVYYGSPAKAAEYFREITGRVDKSSDFVFSKKPSVILNILSTHKESEVDNSNFVINLYKRFVSSNLCYEVKNSDNRMISKSLNSLRSFFYFIDLGFRADIRNLTRFLVMLLVPFVSGVALSVVCRYSAGEEYVYFFNPNLPVWILILLTTSVFIGLATSGHEFIYLRRFYNNLHAVTEKSLSHVFAVFIRYLLITVIQTLLLVLPSVFIIGSQFHFFSVFLYCFALCLWGSYAGLFLSYLMKTTMMVYLLIPLLIIPQLVFSGALINFKNFNKIVESKSDIPLVAEFIPMRWAAEGLMLEFYTNNPYSSKVFQNRCELYNAVYYAEFFLPDIISMFEEDSARAIIILKNEEFKNGFVKNGTHTSERLKLLVKYFDDVKLNCLTKEDSIISSVELPIEKKYRYSNYSIENVIESYGSGEAYLIKNYDVIRWYKPAFKLPQNNPKDYSYFTSYRSFFDSAIKTTNFNLILIFIQSIINSFLLIMFVGYKSIVNSHVSKFY